MKPVKRGFPRRWAIAFYVALIAFTGGMLWYLSATRTRIEPMSAEERQDLVAVDDGAGQRLRHPLLGFSLLHPGPTFAASREAEAKVGFEDDPSTRFHVFTEREGGRMLIVALSRRPGIDGEGFGRAFDAVTRMYLQKTAAGFAEDAPIETLEHRIDRDRRQAALHARIDGKAHLHVSGMTSRFAGDADYLLIVIAVTPADDSLAPLVASVRG